MRILMRASPLALTKFFNYYFCNTAEQELAKLQRQYRIIEGDRRAYSEETQNQIRRQL